jgi:thiamine-phosphate diphosphorylase
VTTPTPRRADLGVVQPDSSDNGLNNSKIGGVVVVTDRRQARAPLPEVVAAAVAGGARWVLLREKDLPRAERAALAGRLRAVLAAARGALVVAGPDPLGGDAIHLAAADPPAAAGAVRLVGRSCHSAAELALLSTEDYVTVSPIFTSTSKPGYGPPLGPAGLRRLCRLAGRPVLALGGIETPAQAAACRRAGASAVAVMSAVMRAADPAAAVAGLAAAIEDVRAEAGE